MARVRNTTILAWLRGFSVKTVNFSRFHYLTIPKRDEHKESETKYIEKWPESLGVMLEF